MGESPSELRNRIHRGEEHIASLHAQGLPSDRSEALLQRLRDQLAILEASEAEHGRGSDCPCRWYDRPANIEEREAEARRHGVNPCLFQVDWPAVHGDPDFQGDTIYFALDEGWAASAPEGAVVYTLSEIEAMKGLGAASIRLLHMAKRGGGVILEAAEALRRDLLDEARDSGATPVDNRLIGKEKGNGESRELEG
jgi:hypothetical protein